MTMFEIQGADGRVHEVEAPDMQSAVKAMKKYSSGLQAQPGSDALAQDSDTEMMRKKLKLHQAQVQARQASQDSLPPAPPELAAFSKAALSGNAPVRIPERNELLGGVLPSLHQAARNLKDNLLGDDDPNSLNRGERIGAAINKAGESLTLGLIGDETSAAVESALGMGRPTTADLIRGDTRTAYERRLDHNREQEAILERDHPGLALTAEVGGALASMALPGGAIGAAKQGAGLLSQAGRGGAVAGAQGATYGFMEGEDGFQERVQDAGNAGLLSAGIGAVATPVTRGVMNALDKRATKKVVNEMVKTAPTPDALKSQAATQYAAGRARGTVLSPELSGELSESITAKLKSEGVMRPNGTLITRDPDAKRIVQELNDLARYGLEGSQVKPVRELFSAAAKDRDPARARIGKIMLDQFDDMVAKHAPEFRQGDALYARAKKTEAVDQMIDLADTSDTANALRREFQKADRKAIRGQSYGMTADEVAAMQRVARGTPAENLARTVGKSAPSSITGAMFTGSTPLIAGSLAGSPGIGAAVGGTAMGAGLIGRTLSNRAQSKHAEIARALMASGGEMPFANASPATKKAIAQIIAALAPRTGQLAVQP